MPNMEWKSSGERRRRGISLSRALAVNGWPIRRSITPKNTCAKVVTFDNPENGKSFSRKSIFPRRNPLKNQFFLKKGTIFSRRQFRTFQEEINFSKKSHFSSADFHTLFPRPARYVTIVHHHSRFHFFPLPPNAAPLNTQFGRALIREFLWFLRSLARATDEVWFHAEATTKNNAGIQGNKSTIFMRDRKRGCCTRTG